MSLKRPAAGGESCKQDSILSVEDILKAIEEGRLSRKQLEMNISSLLKMRIS